MTDKVQKIKEFLIGMADAACCDVKTKKTIETIILPFVDSLQGEQVDYCKLQTSLNNALSKETKESWDKFLQEEPASEDLEEASNSYYDEHWDEHGGRAMVVNGCHDIWFPSQATDDFFKAGANWQKEQMMANAINTKASFTMSVPSICISLPLGVNVGDKVKVIVIKED